MLGVLTILIYQENISITEAVLCFIVAIVMIAETINTYQKGFMYYGGKARVYRNQNPIKFKTFLALHILCALLFSLLSIYTFINYE